MGLDLHDLQPAEGSKKKKKRVGRGTGSGKGKTSGRGHNGQNSRSGGGVRVTFEGGQTPYFKRFPKRGFSNDRFKKEHAVVNVEDLNRFEEDSNVTVEDLKDTGLISKEKDGVKILGDGELEKSLTVKAHKYSKSAVKKIEAAGGKAEVI
ncbi:ribosomal protein L15, bacterial/organelle [Halobacteroides halobius DSM 5150]|uniref:Large ribosomal subunit protein uL15 n=1 Tax=Halobacteroides halobius (strain ATCC 35273 / DSM 5150 / MD-1) TaxID=748449 RepID=L0K774_HALHC|nr:50S ribosomal protein L15 [Halobacteroides halobius]AGB40219.1 ribosomal protein L15, bacterial/organelle [Halobacteroides halobius DSM 5150]